MSYLSLFKIRIDSVSIFIHTDIVYSIRLYYDIMFPCAMDVNLVYQPSGRPDPSLAYNVYRGNGHAR